MTRRLDEWIEGYRRTWEERDAERAAELFSVDARTDRTSSRSRISRGPASRPTGSPSPPPRAICGSRMGRPFVEGSRVAVEFWTTMRVDGDPVTLPGCLMLDFDDEWACRRLREYRHFMPGRLEPPDG
jgi:hypothetical protein